MRKTFLAGLFSWNRTDPPANPVISPAAQAARTAKEILDDKQAWVYTDDEGQFLGLYRDPEDFRRINVRDNWTMDWVDFKTLAVEDFHIGPHYRVTARVGGQTHVSHLAQRIIWEVWPR